VKGGSQRAKTGGVKSSTAEPTRGCREGTGQWWEVTRKKKKFPEGEYLRNGQKLKERKPENERKKKEKPKKS